VDNGPKVVDKPADLDCFIHWAVKPVLFLDSGGVINDNAARAPQWRRLVSAYFAPRLGGSVAAWEEANRLTIEQLLAPHAVEVRYRGARDWISFERAYNRDWLLMMCEIVGVKSPDDETAAELAYRASREIVTQVHAPLDGAVGAIIALHRLGYPMHTASGEYSLDLESILGSLGVRHCFGRLYGPDLVDILKHGPQFYDRVFADAGVRPHRAMVVDDSPRALAWAAEVGAQTVLVTGEPPPGWAAAHVGSLAELPRLLESLV
jgi:HAD superfamily hydrolase (TIGR01509 family)